MVHGEPRPDSTDGPASRWARIATVVVVAVLAPAVLVAIVIVRNPTYSPLDEHAHSDYLRRIEQGEIPRVGDLVLQETVADVQCRTQRGRRVQPCGLPSYDPAIVGAAGYQYEAQQPPAYYAVTALLRQVARIGPVDSFLVSARLTGIAWLSAGLLVFFAACRRLGCRWWPTATATLLLGIGPGVLYQTAAVNNDAAAILTGSLALLMFAHLREAAGRGRIALWCAVAVALVLVKPTGVIAVAAGCGALMLDAWLDRRFTARRGLSLGAPLLAGLVTYLAWGVVREARATISYDVVLEALLSFKMTDHLPLDDTVRNLTKLLQSYAPPGLAIIPPQVEAPATIVLGVFVAVATAGLWVARGGAPAQRVAGVALIALLLAGPAFTILFYVDYSVEGGPAPRYGLSLLPLLFAGGAWALNTRRAMLAPLLFGAVTVAAMMTTMY